MARLSMVMIARDEEENVEPCFESFWDHVDEVVLCDTGSVDGTVVAARAFAEARGEPDKLIVGYFEWCDDFAAARNYADSLAAGDWLCWSDLDDRLIGGEHLRDIVKRAPEWADGFVFDWITTDSGRPTRRERVVRRDAGRRWLHRCGEYINVRAERCVQVPASIAYWRHPPWNKLLDPYYQRLWEKMLADNPRDECALMYLGFGKHVLGEHASAVESIRRYLDLPSPSHRQSLARLMVESLVALDRVDEAFRVAADAHRADPSAPEACVSLAQVSFIRHDWLAAVRWANETLRLGPPSRPWSIVPIFDFTWRPLHFKASSLARLGDLDGAIEACAASLTCCPEDMARPVADFLSELVRRRAQAGLNQYGAQLASLGLS